MALQQIQDDLTADDLDAPELAAPLRELSEDTDPPGGFLASVAQLLTTAAQRAERIDNAGQCLTWSARSLDPQGDGE
ncbi:hypothetical protein [Streptomyces durhamensis]|uniref:hypothetical protein n=1 Tax=Streptomyces durhamensis TaxID=68194 RepID=UPI001FD771B7|nr:hypothetical protein [Streptomyces durhamensis]